ncbi:cytidine deaminase [Candidatus Woesebacteria bacterium]|nr:cytidine deaminase [Candidatus Woesebacteria bacterium]
MLDIKNSYQYKIDYQILTSQDELVADEKDLCLQARHALKTSYSPYSQFRVGCAVLLKDGSVIQGSNQENAAYGPTSCGERSALFAMGSQGKKDQLLKLAVIARPASGIDTAEPIEKEQPGTPCGTCRQVIKEYETLSGEKTVILCILNTDRIMRFEGIDSLLPFGFGPSVL